MPSDIAVGPTTILSSGAPTLKKPPYLITLEDGSGKTKSFQKFISLDKPESVNGFVQVKGIFSDKSEEEIIKSFSEILTNISKESILEMMFPIHRIYSIRNLIFNAVKFVTVANLVR